MTKRILYKSVHEILEYDDLRIFTDLGYEVCSIGSFFDPNATRNKFRTHGKPFNSKKDTDAAMSGGIYYDSNGLMKLSSAFVERFDLCIINHDVDFILGSIDALSRRPLVYRTLGQSSAGNEQRLSPFRSLIKTCRYAEGEVDSTFLTTDSVIHFGKYIDEYKEWSGGGDLLTFQNSIARPFARPTAEQFNKIVAGFPSKHYGIDSRDGLLPPEEQIEAYSRCRAYVYVHMVPASYTLNFIEALAVGVPIIAPSFEFTKQNIKAEWWPERYTVTKLLEGGVGMTYDSVDEAIDLIGTLDQRDLHAISKAARQRARELFGAERIKGEWKSLIESLC